MKNIFNTILWATFSLLWIACSPDQESSSAKITEGSLMINVQSARSANSRAVDAATFGISILNNEGRIVKSFDQLSDAPSSIVLPVGKYTVKAFSAVEMPAVSYDTPYFQGETTVEIVSGQTAAATINCEIKHLLINLSFDASITGKATTYQTTISSANGALVFDKGGKTSGYFERAVLLVSTAITWNDGTTVAYSQVLTGMEEKTVYDLVVKYE